MLIPINVPTGLTERTHIVSGGIHRSGFSDVGVIYTTSENPAASDFDPDFLLNCKVLGPDDREFTITGGYFFERTRSGQGVAVVTTNVFGVALDPSQGFDISEGGSKTIADSGWDHMDPDFAGFNLNERAVQSEAKGWTLIVAEALPDREHYPLSGRPMRMMGTCPSFSGTIEHEKMDETTETVGYKFKVGLDQGTAAPLAYHWNFGDGSEKVSDASEMEHQYDKQMETMMCDVKVKIIVQSECSPTEITLPDIEIPPTSCAQLIKIDTQILKELETELEIQFTARVADSEAGEYTWDFGDGSAPGSGKTVVHSYSKVEPTQGKVFRISVTTSGPGACSSQSVAKKVPWPPAAIGGITPPNSQ